MANRFWNPSADANWGDANVWATTFNGDPTGVATPTSADDCFFTATNSHKCTIGATANCNNLYFDNADNGGNGDFTGGFAGFNTVNIYGSLILSATTSLYNSVVLVFKATSGTKYINMNGVTSIGSTTISASGAIYQLLNNFVIAGANSLTVSAGTLDTNNYNIGLNNNSLSISSGATLKLGTGTLNLYRCTFTADPSCNITNPTGSTIKFTSIGGVTGTFNGGGKTYGNVYFAWSTCTGSITITGSNTFNDFKDDGTAAHTIIFPNSTTTVTTFTVNGTNPNLISLTRTGASGNWTLSASTGTISCNYIQPSNGIATGGATFNSYTANGCVDGGGNTGWNFSGGTVYTLATAPASYSYTPQTSGDPVARKMATSPTSFILTGIAATFTAKIKYFYTLVTAPAQYILTGLDTIWKGTGGWLWKNQTKNNSSYSNQSVNSSIFTDQVKNVMTTGYILLETGFKLLQETGFGILQENYTAIDAGWTNQTQH